MNNSFSDITIDSFFSKPVVKKNGAEFEDKPLEDQVGTC